MVQNLELVLVRGIGRIMRSNVTINECGLDILFTSAQFEILRWERRRNSTIGSPDVPNFWC